MWRRLFSAESAVFLVLWLGLMVAGRSSLLRDPGTFWHVVQGETMLDRGAVPRADSLSFTRAGEPLVADQWLAECGMAAVYRLAGWDGLVLLTAALLAAVYTGVASRLLRAGLHWLPTVLVVGLVLLASSHQFHVRPLVLTIGLLGLVFAMLADVEAGRLPPRRLGWLVPLFIVWVNLHPGVLAGLGTLVLVVLGWIVAGRRTSEVHVPSNRAGLVALVAACSAAVLISPYRTSLPAAWWKTLAMPLPGLIQEHRPLDPADPLAWSVIALGLVYVAALLSVPRRAWRVTWLVPLVWLVLAVSRVRNAPLMAVTAAIALADLLPSSRLAGWLTRRDLMRPAAAWRRFPWPSMALPAALVAGCLAVQAAGVALPVVGRGWARLDPSRWPVGLLPALREISRDATEGTPLFNDLNYGGFVSLYAPRLRVFVDDRCSLYGGEFLTRYERARRGQPEMLDRWQRQYGFRYALVESGGAFDRGLAQDARWTAIGRTPPAVLYRLTAPGFR